MEEGFYLNIARVTNARASDWTPAVQRYVTTHFVKVYCGRFESDSRPVIAEFAKRFPQGDKPGMFVLSVTEWQASGKAAKEETAAAIMSPDALLMATPAETIGDRLFDAVCAVGTAAGSFVAGGLLLATAAFAILPTVTRAETMPAKTGVILMAIDLNGEGWIAGKGDTCEAAMQNAVYPADMVDLKCLPATSPFNHE